MRGLFIHDHFFYRENGLIYSCSGGLPNSVWQRYLISKNTSLIVYARETESTKKGIISSTSRVDFYLSKYYHSPINALSHYKEIKQELEDLLNNVDVVIIRLPSILGIIAAELCRKCGKKYGLEIVGNAFDAYFFYGNLKGKFLGPIMHVLTRAIVAKSEYCLYVTQNYLQKYYPAQKNSLCIACSDVDLSLDFLSLNIEQRMYKIKNRKSDDFFVCGQIGNLNAYYKGYLVMFKAMAFLREQGIIIKYKIAGAGSCGKLQELATKMGILEQVEFCGSLNRQEIISFLDSIDIYVHPSLLEGLPRSIIEAMSRACPCVASSVGGIPELLSQSFLHTPRDYRKLARDILGLIKDTNKQIEQSMRNYEKSLEYNPLLLKEKRFNFYRELYGGYE